MNRLLISNNAAYHKVPDEPVLRAVDHQRPVRPAARTASPFAWLLVLSFAAHSLLILALIILKPLSMTGDSSADREISVDLVPDDEQSGGQGATDGKAGGNNGATQDKANSQATAKSEAVRSQEGSEAATTSPDHQVTANTPPEASNPHPEPATPSKVIAKAAESMAVGGAETVSSDDAAKPMPAQSAANEPDNNDIHGPVRPPPEPKQAKIADHSTKPTQSDRAEKREPTSSGSAKTNGRKEPKTASEVSDSLQPKTTQHDNEPKTAIKSNWDVAVSLPYFFAPEVLTPPEAPVSGEGDTNEADYKGVVYGKLEHAKIYPESARARRAQGHVIVAFSIADDGQVQDLKLVQSSGEADLDAEALAMVQRVSPFPPPKPNTQRFFQPAIIFGLDE
jgi:protein TonB